MKMVAALLAAILALAAGPAGAESLLLSMSADRVVIASNFTGTQVALFGAILPDRDAGPRTGPYDIVVTVRGPSRDIVVRKKERTLGIWINRDQRSFPFAPSFLSVLTSRDPDMIGGGNMQDRHGIGIAATLPGASTPGSTIAEPFSDALIRHYEAAGLYSQTIGGVQLLGGGTLFRATVAIPANVPIGLFEVDVKLFSGEVMLSDEVTTFRVAKSGFESQVFALAEYHPWVYGFGAAALAVLFGWLATVVFRRD